MSHDIVTSLTRLVLLPALAAAGIALAAPESHAAGPDAATTAMPMANLTLRRDVTIDANTVALGDLFDGPISGVHGVDETTVVAYAPQPGRRAVFDADWLTRTAMHYRLNWRPATRLDRVIVERASTVIGAETIADALNAEMANRGYDKDYEIELSNRNLVVHVDSKAAASVEIVNLSVDEASERFTAIVAMPAGDPRAVRTSIAGRIFAMIEVPMPVRTLRPGEAIRERDLAWQPVRAREVRGNMLTDMADLIGQEPVRALRDGAPVRRSDVRVPVTVAKGGTVTMFYETPLMQLTAMGRAEQNGTTGEIISVRNIQTRLVVEARVIGPSRVAVQFAPQAGSNQGLVN